MRNLFISTLLCAAFITACTPARIAVGDGTWQPETTYTVKGRNGFLIKQKLSFGSFETSRVQRSWTKGSGWTFGIPLANDWVERLQVEQIRRRQTLRFSMNGPGGATSEVTAFTKLRWTDLSIGNNPNSLVNIMGDLLKIGDGGTNTYAVRIFTSPAEAPWEMVIDNNAAQQRAKTYTGLLAKNQSEYYTIAPVYQLRNKQGKAVALPLGGSVGFEFRKPGGATVAAVSLIDDGVVYFGNLPTQEQFLLANAAAALLLQQQLDEGV